MKPEQRKQGCAEAEFLPLGEIEYEIYTRRTRQGKPVFRNPDVFSEQLHALAKEYDDRRVIVQDKYSRHRYRSVEKAALQLQEALSNLPADELESLGREQGHCIRAYCSELASNDSFAPDEHDSTLHPIRAGNLLMSHTLIWLQAGAKQLSEPKGKGRPANSLEFWVAFEFVKLSLRQGWTLTVSSTGSEPKSNTPRVESDSVRCLAAVFAKAGMPAAASLRYAKTTLRKFHRSQTRREWDEDCGELVTTLNLKQVDGPFDPLLRNLPNIIPIEKRTS